MEPRARHTITGIVAGTLLVLTVARGGSAEAGEEQRGPDPEATRPSSRPRGGVEVPPPTKPEPTTAVTGDKETEPGEVPPTKTRGLGPPEPTKPVATTGVTGAKPEHEPTGATRP